MGKADVATKKYLSDNERFADIFNYYLYDGEKVIKPENLEERDATETLQILLEDGDVYAKEKYRDLRKKCIIKKDGNRVYVLLGAENQKDIHYAMPVKNMVYDSLDYAAQVERIAKKHKDTGDLKGAEFLSGFSKYDKITPVITLTVYFGNEEWDAPRSLYDMFDEEDADILPFVENYKINLIVPKEIQDMEKFSSDLRYVMGFIKVSEEKEKIQELFEKNGEEYSNMRTDATIVLKECTNLKMNIDEERRETNMCKGIDDMIKDGKIEGRIEGKIEATRENTLDLLGELGTISEQLREKISEQSDFDILKQWHKLSAKVSSIEEFEKKM